MVDLPYYYAGGPPGYPGSIPTDDILPEGGIHGPPSSGYGLHRRTPGGGPPDGGSPNNGPPGDGCLLQIHLDLELVPKVLLVKIQGHRDLTVPPRLREHLGQLDQGDLSTSVLGTSNLEQSHIQMSQAFMNLLDGQETNNHYIYDQLQESAKTQQPHIAALQEVIDTNIQHNYELMLVSMPIFDVSQREDFFE